MAAPADHTDPPAPTPPGPTGTEWVTAFAAAVGVAPPSPAEMDDLLALAGVAAHASERLAAPLACYLVGRAGMPPADGLALARRLAGDDRS